MFKKAAILVFFAIQTFGAPSRNLYAESYEDFALQQLEKHMVNKTYKQEGVSKQYESIQKEEAFQDAITYIQDLKDIPAPHICQAEQKQDKKLADEKGVDIDTALSRYWEPFNEAKHHYEKQKGLLVFVSFSMPQDSLKALTEQVKRVGGQLVFRGMVKNSMKHTARSMMKLKGVRAVIHPKLFEEFRVNNVPTFVLASSKGYSESDKISGNVSLEYVLGEFASRGAEQSKAKSLLSKLRGEA